MIVLLGFLGYAFRDSLDKALPLLRTANRVDIVIAVCLIALYYLSFVVGWQLILRAYGIRLGYRAVLGAEMLSMLAKYVPGGVWTPAARLVAVRRAGVTENSLVLASILLEAGLSAIAGVLVMVAGLPFVSGVDAPLWPVGLFAVLCAFLLHPRVFAPLATRLLSRLGGGPVPPLPWRTSLGVLAYYCLTWLIGGAAFWFLLRSLGDPDVSAIPYLGGVTDVGAIVAVVTVIFPSGLGVREGAVAALAAAVVPEDVAIAAVVLNRFAITIVEAALLAATAVLRRTRR